MTIDAAAVTVVIKQHRHVYNGVDVSRSWYGGAKASGDTIWLPTSKTPGTHLEFVIAATPGRNGFLILEEGHPDYGRQIRQVFGLKFQRCAAQAARTDSRSHTLSAEVILVQTGSSQRTQRLDVPVMEEGSDGQMSSCASSTVAGLKAGGDGFLAVRSGPGTHYRKLDELRNGEVVYVYETRGDWAGVAYRTPNANCSSTQTRPVPHRNTGWVHTKWLKNLAG